MRRAYRDLFFYRISARLKKRFSAAEWAAIGSARVVTFPEHVDDLYFVYVLWKILKVARIRISPFSPFKVFDVCINFQDITFSAVDLQAYMTAAYARAKHPEPRVRINYMLDDISKHRVGRQFADSFGYELNVDPRRFEGLAVRKSNLNGAHDGAIVRCPIRPDEFSEKMSYTVLVDNTEGSHVLDLRLPIIKHATDFCYLKRRPVSDRFSNTNDFVTIEKSADLFSSAELDLIEKFCRGMRLDYGELDCARDQLTQRLYILDVSKTPAGPPNGLPKDGQRYAIEEMAYVFCRNFILDGSLLRPSEAANMGRHGHDSDVVSMGTR